MTATDALDALCYPGTRTPTRKGRAVATAGALGACAGLYYATTKMHDA